MTNIGNAILDLCILLPLIAAVAGLTAMATCGLVQAVVRLLGKGFGGGSQDPRS